MRKNNNIVAFVTSAKVPANSPTSDIHSVISMGLMINYETGVIENVSSTFISGAINEFLHDIIVDRNIHKEFKEILDDIEVYYNGSAKWAIRLCLKKDFEDYIKWREKRGMPPIL